MTKFTDQFGLPYPEGRNQVAVHTDIEQLAKGVDREISPRLSDQQIILNTLGSRTERLSATLDEVSYRSYSTAQWLDPSKNMLNPDEFLEDHFLSGSNYVPVPLNGYTTSGFVRVIPGETYATTARAWGVYGEDETLVERENTNTNHEPITITVPEGAVWMRLAWASSLTPGMQLEHGTQVTDYQPYGVTIPRLITDTSGQPPVTARIDPVNNGIVVSSLLGDRQISVLGGPYLRETGGVLDGPRITDGNGVYNIGALYYNGTIQHVATTPDEITPLRTEAGTVGANHGFPYFQNWASHDKTVEDLGSIWTDGAREWTLVAITPAGRAHFAPDPVIASSGEATIPTSLAGDMVHVSGAANTATLPQAGANRGSDQVRPAVTRRHLAYYVDGVRLSEGTRSGLVVEIRESYEIIDYRSLLSVARANPGQSYAELDVDGAIRVRTTYTYTGGCSCVVHTELTELSPSRLAQTGFIQAQALGGSQVHRIVPGVIGWDTPVNLADHTTNDLVTTDDLLDPNIPPVMTLDNNGEIAFALGYRPWSEGAASSPARIASNPARFWDLRGTNKSYPVAFTSAAPGWGRITATGYRVYLTPEDAEAVARESHDAHAADAALESFTSI